MTDRMAELALIQPARTLEELAQAINEGNARVEQNLRTSLHEAIKTGHALLEAQSLLPTGAFSAWLEANCTVTRSPAYAYMRLAIHEHLLPTEFLHPTIERAESGRFVNTGTIPRALAYLRSAGSNRDLPDTRRTDYDEIRRLADNGMPQREIAAILGCSETTVWRALLPAKDARALRAKEKRRQNEQRRLLAQARRQAAAAATKGDIAEAYSLLRKCLQHVQTAYDATPTGKARRALQGTLTHLHSAEDALGRAAKENAL